MRTNRRSELCLCLMIAAVATLDGNVLSGAEQDGPASGTPVSDNQARVANLIEQLGASKYQEREAATDALLRIGAPALSFLHEGRKNTDIEVNSRCHLIAGEIERVERQRLIDSFLSSSNPVNPELLPGWHRFRDTHLNSDRTKSAYIAMMREEWYFVEDVLNSESITASQYLANRCRILQNRMRLQRSKITEGTMCALLFVASLQEIEVPNPGILLGFCTRSECQNFFIRGEHSELLNHLLAKVIRKPLGESTLAQRIYLSSRYGLKDGVEIAREVVLDTGVRTYVRQSAILLMARFGDDRDCQQLKPLLHEDTVSIQARNVQIRDIALAALIHLHGENVEDYGFADVRTENMMVYSASTLGFKSDAERAHALALWYQRHGQ